MIEGTGLCKCDAITEVEEVCDRTCQKNMPVPTLDASGKITVHDPVTDTYSEPVDPSSLPGYYGDFKCQTTDITVSKCNMRTMAMTEDGSFAYEFQPNANILNATNTNNNSALLSSSIRRENALRKATGINGRRL
jgi:hypothetical protein